MKKPYICGWQRAHRFRLRRGGVGRMTTQTPAEIRAEDLQRGLPWFPEDLEAWSVRWVLLHLIEETARHCGHLDLLREGIDGTTGE